MTVIGSGAQIRIAACGLHMLALSRGCFDVALARRRHFSRGGLRTNAAIAAVVTHAGYVDIVDNRFVVYVGDMR
jgi:hypothetical protein